MSSREHAGDVTTTDTPGASRIIGIAGVVTAAGFTLLVIARLAAHDPGFVATLGIGGAVSLLTIWINKKGHVRAAGILLIAMLVGIPLFLMISSEGTHDASMLMFPGILVLAALILPRRTYVGVAALIVCIPAFVGALEIGKTIVSPLSGRTDLLGLADITVILIMTAAAVELMLKTVTESSSRARASEARYQSLFNSSSESVFVFEFIGPEGIPGMIVEVNEIACRQFGYARGEFMHLSARELFSRESRNAVEQVFTSLIADGAAVCECTCRTKEGRLFPVELSTQRFAMEGKEAIIANGRDITERKRSDDLIRSALREKDVLLREVHHRVKNNMQVISSLLNLQASQTSDPAARATLEESRQRVRSIALIHEKLYNSGNMASIDFGAYLKSVADELLKTFGRPDVSCRLDLEGIRFEIDRAIPAGLIVNELLTNSLRHAFPPGTSGTVWVRLRSLGDGRVELVVQDDGIGFAPGADPSTSATLGLAIVKTLVEQMQGTFSMEGAHGATWTIQFSLDKDSAAIPEQTGG